MALTITKNTNVSFDIAAQAIEDFVTGQPSPGFTLKFFTKYQCGTEIELDIEIGDITLGAPNLYNVPASVYGGTELADGVYFFDVRKIPDDVNVDETDETACSFLDNETQCTVYTEVLPNDNTSLAPMYHEALLQTDTCSKCDCLDACRLFTELQNIINGTTTSTTYTSNSVTNDCGCG